MAPVILTYRQAPVVKLLCLHRLEFLLGLGLHSRGIPVQVTRHVVLLKSSLSSDGVRCIEGNLDLVVLDETDAEEGKDPELGPLGSDLLEVSNCRANVVGSHEQWVE